MHKLEKNEAIEAIPPRVNEDLVLVTVPCSLCVLIYALARRNWSQAVYLKKDW